MPRAVRDSNLESRTARSKLKVRHDPYYRLIEPGLHIGYRKLRSGPGSWLSRRYVGDGRYRKANLTTGDGVQIVADDFGEADGAAVMTFGQAQEAIRQPRSNVHVGPYLVRQAMDAYFATLEADGRDTYDAKKKADAHIFPVIGDKDAAALTTEELRKWHRGITKHGARVRTKVGKTQRHREFDASDPESLRKRQASANRIWTILRAGLNQAFRDGKIPSDVAWRRVKPFKGVDVARLRYLTIPEAKRLINACEPDFRQIVQAALLTGARYGQICALIVSDFNRDNGTVRLRTRKGDGSEKTYHCTLTDEGAQFFKRACAGRSGSDLMFSNKGRVHRALARLAESESEDYELDDDGDWRASEQTRPMAEVCERAKIDPPIGFHILRHTWASHAVMSGVSLLVVAKNLGHSDTRMVEKHYGHLAPSYVQDEIRRGAPKFGIKSDSKIMAFDR